jgi:imidazoleglycerol-phosphate dehydratase/histidinol-phosphatase
LRRKTNETDIRVYLDLDARQAGAMSNTCNTGIGFFDHMLDQLASHGGFLLELECTGDLQIDEHHTVEDCALTLGEALDQALGDRRGIGRYGFTLPMDESLAQVAIDLSGRPAFDFEAEFPREQLGDFSTEMVRHFFASLSQSLRAAIHMQVKGENTHHMIEALFKGAGRALRPALARDGFALPSTKGSL